MARSEAAKRADAKYKAKNTRQFIMRFYPGDADILAHLEDRPNKQGYVKELIREDMEHLHPVKGTLTAWKYSCGTYCGNGDFTTLDQALAFADDGFCDYVRVRNAATGQVVKMHFTPTEGD